jgi:pimeloyl-ACP methyl ester carboxylesterase
VLGDLETACGGLGLSEPAVAGWSLGGMIAVLWAERHPTPQDVAAQGFRRNLTIRDGQTWLRPLPHVLATLQTAMADLDIIPVYRQVKCPLLVALATDDLQEQQPFHELYAAYRRGFESRLAEASDANPCFRVARVEGATHAMVAERPAEIAQLITRFAAISATWDSGAVQSKHATVRTNRS